MVRQVRPGLLRDIITFEVVTGEQDEAGQVLQVWTPFPGLINVRANVNPGTGKKFEQAQQRIPTMTHLISIRAIPDAIATKAQLCLMRIRIGDRILQNEAPTLDSGHDGRMYVFSCKEIIPTVTQG